MTEKFNAFWLAYDHKIGKDAALKIWKRDKLDKIADAIIASIPAYDAHLAANTWKHKAHASTWLNQKRYEDEYPEPKKSAQEAFLGHSASHFTTAAEYQAYHARRNRETLQ